TYIGGTYEDRITGIAVDSAGNAILAGYSSSPDMPLVSALQPALRGTRNAFVAKLNDGGNGLIFSTYFGGSGADVAAGIARDNSGNIYVDGNTSSLDFPTLNAFQSTKAGPQNGFVFKL